MEIGLWSYNVVSARMLCLSKQGNIGDLAPSPPPSPRSTCHNVKLFGVVSLHLFRKEIDVIVMAAVSSTGPAGEDSNREVGYNRSACTECQRRKQKVRAYGLVHESLESPRLKQPFTRPGHRGSASRIGCG
jgi:hypothetical protein